MYLYNIYYIVYNVLYCDYFILYTNKYYIVLGAPTGLYIKIDYDEKDGITRFKVLM